MSGPTKGPVARASRGYAKVTHGTHLVALVRAGAEFENGKLVERPADQEVTLKPRDTPIHRS